MTGPESSSIFAQSAQDAQSARITCVCGKVVLSYRNRNNLKVVVGDK